MTLTELRAIAEREASSFSPTSKYHSASIVYENAFNPQVALALLGCAEVLLPCESAYCDNEPRCGACNALAALKDAGVSI